VIDWRGRGWRARLYAWSRRLKDEIAVVALALRDPATPRSAKWLGALVVAYALSPIDLIPDFIPVLGYLDDAVLLPLGLWLVLRLIPKDVLDAVRDAQAADPSTVQLPRSTMAAAVIIGLWIVSAVVVAWWFLGKWLLFAP
jgi:uncharacterized membrane protein YkvA (DUF1232 family)